MKDSNLRRRNHNNWLAYGVLRSFTLHPAFAPYGSSNPRDSGNASCRARNIECVLA